MLQKLNIEPSTAPGPSTALVPIADAAANSEPWEQMPDLSELLDLLSDEDATPPPSSKSIFVVSAPRVMLVQAAVSNMPKAARELPDAPQVKQITNELSREVNIKLNVHRVCYSYFYSLFHLENWIQRITG